MTVLDAVDHARGLAGESDLLTSAGRPALGVEIAVVDEDGREVPPGETGEVVTRGDHVMAGYWNADQRTDLSKSVVDGWLHTGDLGRLSADGHLWLVDRKGDMIISGGYNIYPREVEDVIAEVPSVAEVAVVGVADQDWGQRVVALVTARPGASVDTDAVLAHCRDRMASYKKPKEVRVVSEVNSTGKIAKKLRQQLDQEGQTSSAEAAGEGEDPQLKADYAPEGAERPGEFPYTRGLRRAEAVDHGAVRRLRHAARVQRALPAAPRRGRHRVLRRHGPADPDGHRQRRPRAAGEVGRVGVAIDSLADIEILMDGIPLEKISQVRTTANSIGYIWAALFIALAEKRDVSPNEFGMFIQNDVLKEFIARGTQIFPPEPSLRLAVDCIEYCAEHVPNWTPLAMSGYHIRESGPRPRRRSRSPSPTPAPTSTSACAAGCPSTRWHRRCSPSSPSPRTCCRRSRSSAPPAACGPG